MTQQQAVGDIAGFIEELEKKLLFSVEVEVCKCMACGNLTSRDDMKTEDQCIHCWYQ